MAKSDAHNLWERMQKHETAVLRFAKHPDVAFTNNRANADNRIMPHLCPNPLIQLTPSLELSA